MCSRKCVCAFPYEVYVIYLIVVQCCLFNFGFCASERSKREIIEDSVQSYLMKYGYLTPTADGAGALRTEESVRKAIKEMQQFAGLPVTGSLDESTVKLLHKPRCGLPDVLSDDRRRSKRYVVHSGKAWPYTNLTWSLRSTNIPNVDTYEARVVFARALDIWSQHSKLTFTEVNSDKADILIYFHRGEHGDNFAFDGKGSVLAHAFFPGPGRGGDAHFDMDEIWLTKDTDNMNEEGTNLFKVAAHEFGHSLGLSHSNVSGALMAPWYQAFQSSDYVLPEDDRQGIQFLYGSREDRLWEKIPHYATVPTTHRTTRPTNPPDRRHHNNPYYPYYPHDPRTHSPHRPYPELPKTEKPPYIPRKPMHPDKKIPSKYPDKPHHYPNHYPKDGKYPQKHYPLKPREEYPKYPERTPDRYPDRVPQKYPVGRTDRYPDRTPDRYPDRTPDRYPERTPDRFPEKVPKNPDRYPSRTPERHPPRVPETEKTTIRVPIRHYPSMIPTKTPPPNTCDTSFDAVAVIRREVFFFKDAYFWRIGDTGLLKGYPAQISRMWAGLPTNFTNVDAVYERPDNKIVFFIGRQIYVYTGNQLERGYPKPLTFLGLPESLEHIDGATVWGHNGKTFFFSGNMYWRFDEDTMKVELDYPRSMKMWNGVGNNIDAVFQWKDGKTYFFKGKGFWKFNDLRMRVEEEEQIPSGPFWMGCTRNFQSHHYPSKEPYVDDSGSNTNMIRSNFTIVIALGVILKLYALIT